MLSIVSVIVYAIASAMVGAVVGVKVTVIESRMSVVGDTIMSMTLLLESLSLDSVVHAVNGGVVGAIVGAVSAVVWTVRSVP